jgi:ankyrin repeat protein
MKTLRSILVIIVILFLSGSIYGQAIFDAVKNNDLPIVKKLVEHDASIINLKDNSGNTPLHYAAINGSFEMTDILISAGADINAPNTLLNTPLHEALSNRKDELARMLIMKGADVKRQNSKGSSPLHIAVLNSQKPTVELLIEKGADLESRQIGQATPLNLITLMSDNYEIAKLLIEKGADINSRNRNGSTPLDNAAGFEAMKILDLLLDNKAEFDTANNGTVRMLRTAAFIGSSRLFRYVADKKGDELFKNDADNKILMSQALKGGSLEMVKILQSKNIPVDISPDFRGWTPLHYAVARNNPEMMEFLSKNGANINKRTLSGKSPYNIAEENENKELMNLIVKSGGNTDPQQFPVLTGPYLGQKLLGKIPERFAPDIVIPNHSTITISPDGSELYWNSGPAFGDGPIMMTKLIDGKWIKPVEAPFSGKKKSHWDDCPFVTPDNKKLFFISSRPIGNSNSRKENIWYVERIPSGWSEPVPAIEEINAMTLHWQVSVSEDGNLYFVGGDESGSFIRLSRFINGKYAKPEIVVKEGGASPFISPDESYLIFSRLISGRATPFICFKNSEGLWQKPVNIEKYVGNGVCCIVSPDRKYLFKDGWWMDAGFIEDLRKEELNKEGN